MRLSRGTFSTLPTRPPKPRRATHRRTSDEAPRDGRAGAQSAPPRPPYGRHDGPAPHAPGRTVRLDHAGATVRRDRPDTHRAVPVRRDVHRDEHRHAARTHVRHARAVAHDAAAEGGAAVSYTHLTL